MRLMLRGLLCALLAGAAPARAAQDFSIDAHGQGGAVIIHTQARIHAHYPVIWSTLTDYEQLPYFIPDLKTSKVLEKHGDVSVVEQKGVMEILMFSYPIDVTVQTFEHQPDKIGVHLLKGNLKQLDGGYTLEPVPGLEHEYLLSWHGVIESDFAMPAFITVPLMRSNLRRQFLGMVGEIERREALLPKAGPL